MLLKSSLYVSSPLPSDIRLSSLSISLASTCKGKKKEKKMKSQKRLLVQEILIKRTRTKSSMDVSELKTNCSIKSEQAMSKSHVFTFMTLILVNVSVTCSRIYSCDCGPHLNCHSHNHRLIHFTLTHLSYLYLNYLHLEKVISLK